MQIQTLQLISYYLTGRTLALETSLKYSREYKTKTDFLIHYFLPSTQTHISIKQVDKKLKKERVKVKKDTKLTNLLGKK